MQLSSISLAITRLGAMPWTPGTLFTAGEQGVWYDPADFSTLFQDAAGTIPVTAVEQPVGKMLDKSGRGNHATQATTTKRPALKQDANGCYYLSFDGVDDAMQTGNIDFTGTDKMTVVAGVRKLSDASVVVICEFSSISSTINGSFALYNNTTGKFQFQNRGTVLRDSGGVIASAPVSKVVTGIAAISEDIVKIRGNGVEDGANLLDQGAGNYGNYPLYIGSRAGTSLPFNGHLYSLIVRGAQSTDAQIVSAETYVNSKTGAY